MKILSNLSVRYSAISSLIQSIITSATFLILYLIILKVYGDEYLGFYSLLAGLIPFYGIFGTGIAGVILRYVPAIISTDKKLEHEKYLSTGLKINILIGLSLSIIFLLVKEFTYEYYFNNSFSYDFFSFNYNLTCVIIMINYVNIIFMFFFDSIKQITKRNIVVIISNICLIFSALLLIYNDFNFSSIFIALALQSLTQFVFYILFLKQMKYKINLFSFEIFEQKKFLNFGNKFQLLNLLIILQDVILKYLISKYISLSGLGLYELFTKLFTQFKTVFTLSLYPFLPRLTRFFELRSNKIKIVFDKMNKLTVHLGSILSSLFFVSFSLLLIILNKNNNDFSITDQIFVASNISISIYFTIYLLPIYYFFQAIGKIRYLNVFHGLYTIIVVFLFLFFKSYIDFKFLYLPSLVAIIVSSFILFKYFRNYLKRNQLNLDINFEKSVLFNFTTHFFVMIISLINYNYFILFFLVLVFIISSYLLLTKHNKFIKSLLRWK